EAADLDVEARLLVGLAQQSVLDRLAALDAARRQAERLLRVVLLRLEKEETVPAADRHGDLVRPTAIQRAEIDRRQRVEEVARAPVAPREARDLRLHGCAVPISS